MCNSYYTFHRKSRNYEQAKGDWITKRELKKNLGNLLFLTAFWPYFLHRYPSSRISTWLLVWNAYLCFFPFFFNSKLLEQPSDLTFEASTSPWCNSGFESDFRDKKGAYDDPLVYPSILLIRRIHLNSKRRRIFFFFLFSLFDLGIYRLLDILWKHIRSLVYII